MNPFTPDEIFDLLANVSCKRDLLEISQYCAENVRHYTILDNSLFLQAVRIYMEAFGFSQFN